MPVSALPSRTGVGELGSYVHQWLKILENNGVKIWQILPLNPVGYGNSPYQPYSSYAGDELYISLDNLYEEGLITELPPSFCRNKKRVDYDKIRIYKEPYLREAYKSFVEKKGIEQKEYQNFLKQEWLYDYGVFRALKASNKMVCWNEWPKEQKDWPERREKLPIEIETEIDYHIFLQYLFFTQWMEIKSTANERGIDIMGDVPFYVGIDSADVWAGKKNFLLDSDGKPIFIAGVPPDYFSATGQRWGNPIYDWDYLKGHRYQFWVDRIGYNSKLFDIVRIDHFRAFDTFWKIPATCSTAIEGEWVEAPGYEVMDTLIDKISGMELVAEDLGDLRPEVLDLKNHYHLKGMKIVVFSINTDGKYAYDSFFDVENMIIYTGTHDNDTLMEWYSRLSCARKRKVRRFLKSKGFKRGSIQERLLAYTLKSKAEYAILPLTDIMGLGKEAHFNMPGTVGAPNWEWRLPNLEKAECALKKFKAIIANRIVE